MRDSLTPMIVINLALVFYSIGVWSERLQGLLKWRHFAFFVLGLICDTWGTGLMFEMVGGMTYDLHGITGLAAIILMFVHALWALVVLLRRDEKAIRSFHRFSVFVWVAWLVPYLSPMMMRMFG
ncbi:MAG: TIGR03987 family protein [Anaerolineales bacterium]|nr:TIGR03987 family protein [Anaerolineales bacterium]